MISIGAAVAAGISQGKSTTLGFDTRWSVYSDFRNDKEKRDFIVCGASAGIAAAFNAPVGGVLFTYEESASFWSKNLTWRAFFTAMVATYIIDFLLNVAGQAAERGKLTMSSTFNFSYENVWEILLFILLGALGGGFGALFVQLNKVLTRLRIRYVNPSNVRRLLDVVVLKTVVSVATFFVPYFLGTCADPPNPLPAGFEPITFYCSGGQYNDIASFWFMPTEEAIRQLYHFPTAISILHIGVFFLVYTLLMCCTAGASVPAGIFIPTLLSGAALGRFVGETANYLLPATMQVDAGTYALVGSAAMLAGTMRMTISIAVILLECTGSYQYGLPIMVTVIAARLFGNLFSPGIYDMAIELRKWPMLEDHVPKKIADELRVSDVMTTDLLVLKEVEKVGRVFDTLRHTEFSGFPVIYSEEMMRSNPRLGNLAGYIQRKHLSVLLARRAFHAALPTQLVLLSDAAAAGVTYPMPPVFSAAGGAPSGGGGGGGGGTSTTATAATTPFLPSSVRTLFC